MPWPTIAAFAIIVAMAGILSLAFVIFGWPKVDKFYSATRSKNLTSIMKLFAGVIAFGARLVAESDQKAATIATVSGLVGLCVWEVVGILGDSKLEASRKKYDRDFEVVKGESHLRIMLLAALVGLVHQKKQKVWQEYDRRRKSENSKPDKIASIKSGLDIHKHPLTIIQHLANFLREQLPHIDESAEQNFRIGLYVEKEGLMTPVVSWDMIKKKEMAFTSYQRFPQYFKIDCISRPSCVVRCFRNKEILIIPDFEKEPTGFFFEDQKKYLKSLVAYPIVDYGCPSAPIPAVLIVDTNVIGFFKTEDKSNINSYLDQFAARLDLEASISVLLHPITNLKQESTNGDVGREQTGK